ncbi:MAG: NHL repeat-containing protein [Candidatus Acidiferrales bacterium]
MSLGKKSIRDSKFCGNDVVPLVAACLLAAFAIACAGTPSPAQEVPPAPPLAFIAEWGASGGGAGQLSKPEWMATDFAGNVFIADYGSGFIHKFNFEGHPLLSFDAGVPRNPYRVAVDSGNGIYAIGEDSNVLYICSPQGEHFRHFALAPQRPHQVAQAASVDDAGDIFVIVGESESKSGSELARPEIREYNARGRLLKKLAMLEGSSAAPFVPASLVAASDGYLYVVDATSTQVEKFTLSGDYVTAWGSPPAPGPPGSTDSPGRGIAVTSKYVFVAEPENRGVRAWTVDGHDKIVDDLGGRLKGANGAYQVATSRRGELLVLDFTAAKVLRFKINF